jgi:hypothetical protein
LSADPRKPAVGIPNPEQAIPQLEKEISSRISPPLQVTIDAHENNGKKVLRVLIPHGEDPPYVVDDYKIYVRDESETGLAVRDEIVSLVKRGQIRPEMPVDQAVVKEPAILDQGTGLAAAVMEKTSPRTGVEVVSMEEREGTRFFTVRDLRNGNVVKNVTPNSARRLWHYALSQYMQILPNLTQANIQWVGNFGLLQRDKQGKRDRYDLIQRTPDGYRFYFGVTDDGIHGPWKQVVGQEDE